MKVATSDWRQICAVMEHVEDAALAPRPPNRHFKVLDVGCGWGRYGVLVKGSWPDAVVVGMDAVDRRLWITHAYGGFMRGRLPHRVPRLGRFDIVLFIDVVEHLEEEQGAAAIDWCTKRGPTVVATPNGFMEQDGPELDRHRSGWTADSLRAHGACSVTHVPSRTRPPTAEGPGQLVAYFGAT